MRMCMRPVTRSTRMELWAGGKERARAKSYGQAKRKRTGRADASSLSTRKELWAGGKEVHLTVVWKCITQQLVHTKVSSESDVSCGLCHSRVEK